MSISRLGQPNITRPVRADANITMARGSKKRKCLMQCRKNQAKSGLGAFSIAGRQPTAESTPAAARLTGISAATLVQ